MNDKIEQSNHEQSRRHVEDLKSFAGKFCIDIFNDFSVNEMQDMPRSIREAWDIGRALTDAST